MTFLQTRPGKVILIWLLSLLAAAVCFGLLQSSGVLDNGAVELGGAFAGFVVSLYVLNRVWGPEDDLVKKATSADDGFLYEEVLKALDLRHASPTDNDQLALLTDYYHIRRLGSATKLEMHYATTSDEIQWLRSPTHSSAKWELVGTSVEAVPEQDAGEHVEPVSHTGYEGQRFRREYLLTVSLGQLAEGEATAVINNVAYKNAFRSISSEWLETHMEKPTRRLTMFVLGPDDMRISDATGYRKVERDHTEESNEQPQVIRDGSVVYWSVNRPQQGVRYALRWEWEPRTVAAATD